MEHALDAEEADQAGRFRTIGEALRVGAMRLVAEDESGVLYSYEDVLAEDVNLLQAAEQTGVYETGNQFAGIVATWRNEKARFSCPAY